MTVLPFVLAAMAALQPNVDHAELSQAIATVVDAERPLFRDDVDRRRTAALVVAVAFRESSFVANAVGDHGRSFCAFQIHRSSGGSPALLDDPEACVRTGVAMLRTSLRVCPSHPIAWYARGPRGCAMPRAQRISRDRVALARWLVRTVVVPGAVDGGAP